MQRWVKKCVWCLPVIVLMFIAGVAHAEGDIILISSDGEPVAFPKYMKFVSSVIEESVGRQVDYQRSVLEELTKYCDVLPKAARDTFGNKVSDRKITKKTLFLNSAVSASVHKLLSGGSPRDTAMLFQICDAAHGLKIAPLENAFSFAIAKRIFQPTHDLLASLNKDSYFKHKSSQERFQEAVERALTAEQEALSEYQHEFTDVDCTKNQASIEKYIHLLLAGAKNEFTIADYIARNGQKSWCHNGQVLLSGNGVTSLEGLHLVQPAGKIQKIDLSNNFIHNTVTDKSLSWAFSRFKRLKHLSLSNNHLEHLPGGVFKHNTLLEFLNLDTNKLSQLSPDVYKGFKHLKKLSIRDNPSLEDVATILWSFPNGVVDYDQVEE